MTIVKLKLSLNHIPQSSLPPFPPSAKLWLLFLSLPALGKVKWQVPLPARTLSSSGLTDHCLIDVFISFLPSFFQGQYPLSPVPQWLTEESFHFYSHFGSGACDLYLPQSQCVAKKSKGNKIPDSKWRVTPLHRCRCLRGSQGKGYSPSVHA